jgi:hypothetical protein
MRRTIRVCFKRDPSRDRTDEQIHFEGYGFYWPDGRPLTVGLDSFCNIGQRVLGLRTFLEGRSERLLELLCFHLETGKERMTSVPGSRVRRFFIERQGRQGRVHLFDGKPTAVVFNLDDDEQRVLDWIGLSELADGERRWFDLTARCPAQMSLQMVTTESSQPMILPT